MKRERVTEVIVRTVARRTVAGVAVDQYTVGRVATKVSLNAEFISRKNNERNCSWQSENLKRNVNY